MEALWFEILLPKTKPILCGCIYRPPRQTNFYDLLENVCSSNSCFNESECIILGDFNTDVSSTTPRNVLFKHLQSFIHMFNFTQFITDFTRVSNSSSIIDLILVSDREKNSQSGVILVGLSDHSIIYCKMKVSKDSINKHNSVKVRSLKSYNNDDFQMNLINTDWSPVLLSDMCLMHVAVLNPYF